MISAQKAYIFIELANNLYHMISRSRRIRTWTVAVQPHHLPYPLNPGLLYHVPTYPRTRSSEPALANAGDISVPFGKLRAGSGSLLCYLSRGLFFYPMGPGFLPTKPFGYAQGRLSRLCSCFSLIIAVHLNKITGVHLQETHARVSFFRKDEMM